MFNTHQRPQPAKAFRPTDPREYDYAQQNLATRGRTIGDYLHASIRWFNQDPERALTTLAPVWPPPRVTGRRALATAYAVLDEDGEWMGKPRLLPEGRYHDYPMAYRFKPSDPYNPLSGQVLTLRCGQLPDDDRVAPAAVHVVAEGKREIAVRVTYLVQDALFGPPILGTPERAEWDARREQRRLQMEPGRDRSEDV